VGTWAPSKILHVWHVLTIKLVNYAQFIKMLIKVNVEYKIICSSIKTALPGVYHLLGMRLNKTEENYVEYK
jgi:hypothetical protein